MMTRFELQATIHAPVGITNPFGQLPTLIERGFPNGDKDAPGGPGGHACTGSIYFPPSRTKPVLLGYSKVRRALLP